MSSPNESSARAFVDDIMRNSAMIFYTSFELNAALSRARRSYVQAAYLLLAGLFWGWLLISAPLWRTPGETLTGILLVISLAAIIVVMMWRLVVAVIATVKAVRLNREIRQLQQ